MKITNEIIILGGNHHNMLGIIRALGKEKLKSIIIITDNNKYFYTKKSKYVKNIIAQTRMIKILWIF